MAAREPASLVSLLEGALDCVHCGLCLSACPTYRETGRETSSPRGRVYLMRAAAEGRLPLQDIAQEAWLCLGCRACETACPSGVRFGRLLECTRAEVERAGVRRGGVRLLERFALRHVIVHRRRLHWLVSLLGWLQRSGIEARFGRLLPSRLRAMQALLPEVPDAASRSRLPPFTPALGPRRGRVAFLTGCIMPELFGPVNRASVRVLARNGFDVLVPEGQGCCGALHAHAGDEPFAHALARRNLAAFSADVDAVVTDSAGCGAVLREMRLWLPGEAETFSSRVRDVCELLDAAGLRPPAAGAASVELRVCYDDPCHLVHAQGVRDAPRRLLGSLPGLHLVPHADPTSCCGAAGTYNLTHPEMSRAVLERKLDALAAADPDVIASGNPGCLMQLRAGARARGLRARVAHPVELIDQAYA